MNVHRTKRWGFILLFVGFAIGIPGVWLLIAPNRYEATARIKVTNRENANDQSYNPYFLQTEFEVIKSDLVLTKVVTNLSLDVEWGKRYADGHKLEMPEAIGLLKQSLRLTPVQNTMLVDISFTSEVPDEAAKVANGIAEAYVDWRKEQFQALYARSVQGLKEQQAEQQKKIAELQTNVDHLTLEMNSPSLAPEDKNKKIVEYNEATNTLERAKLFDKIIEMKILTQTTDQMIPDANRFIPAQVVEPAQTPTVPSNANRRVGKDLILAGVLVIFFGVRLLWRAYFAAPPSAA